MRIVADTHVHLYPSYNLSALFTQALANLQALDPARDNVYALFLTERRDCFFFRDLRAGRLPLNDRRFTLAAGPDPACLVLRHQDGTVLYVFAGRQLVTRENLEVLALLTEADLAEGAATTDVIQAVRAAGGVPVLPWSPGKWFGARGKLVHELLNTGRPDQFLLADSALRPLGWGWPLLLCAAERLGYRVLAGTDPLPLPGEEARAGAYGIGLEAAFDPDHPTQSLRTALLDGRAPLARLGRRLDPYPVARVLLKLRAVDAPANRA